SSLSVAEGAEKILTVSQADFVMSQEEASRFSAEVVSRIAFDYLDEGTGPDPLRPRIQTLLEKIQRHEIDYTALPAYFRTRKLNVLAKVERLDSRPTVILFIPAVMTWKKTMTDSEFKYGLL